MILTKVIITALFLEAELIIEKYKLKKKKELGSLQIFEGERVWEDDEKEHIVLAVCGEGKIQSAFATTYLCENYSFEKIVNIGIVGNLNPEQLKIGDVILPNTFVMHDYYMPESIDFSKHLREPIFLEYAIGEEYDLEKFSLHLSGICATGDMFVDNDEISGEIKEKFGADIVDMEAYGILSVLRNYNLLDKAAVIKAVSDEADDTAEKNSMENLKTAMQNSVAILDFTL